MSRPAFAAFGLAAALLAWIVAAEVRSIEGDAAVNDAAAAAVARWRPAPEAPAPAAPDRTGEWAATALARPLFAQDRRPVAEARSAAAAGGPAGRELPRLAGVLVGPGGSAAIFATAGDNTKPQVLRIGDHVGAYEVKAIVTGEVTLAGPDGDRTLRPSFDPRPAGGGGAPRPVAVAPPTGFVPAAVAGTPPGGIQPPQALQVETRRQ